MESWSYGSEGKGLSFTDEMDFPVDAFARTRKPLPCWDIKPSTGFEPVESMEFVDFGFSDMNKKPFYGNTSLAISGAEFANDSAEGLVPPTCVFASGSYFGEEDSGSKHVSSVMESNSQESSLIDLNLGRLANYREAEDGKLWNDTCVVSSVHWASTAAKRGRRTNSPCCQVYGCNKDLSSSKDYHKRHKVCEAHSKTAKVIVHGIEQRFCQQCSRFHLLAEFDDGKRSCRRRLAGHNERRRKHHFNNLPGKPSKLLQTYQGMKYCVGLSGTKFLGSSMPKGTPSHAFQGDSEPESAIPITNGQLVPPKPSSHVHGIFGTFSSATEAFNDPNVASTLEELYGVPHSDCALSLLSAQSHYSSSHADHSSEKANGFRAYGTDTGVSQERSIGVSHAGHSFNFEVQTNGLLSENGTGVDLLKLSTNLQRVERKRNSNQVRQENEDMCCSITN